MTAKDVLSTLCGRGKNCLWDPARVIAVPNTTAIVGWEADLLILHKSRWVWEIEIKVSVADLRREFTTKSSKHKTLKDGSIERVSPYGNRTITTNKHVQKFFFAVPKDVYDKLKPGDIPDYAGVIVIDPERVDYYGRPCPKVIKQAKKLPGATKATDAFYIRLLELAYARFWAFAYANNQFLSGVSNNLDEGVSK